MPKKWIPDFTGKATSEVAYALQQLYLKLEKLEAPKPPPPKPPSITDIRSALQADGNFPIKVTGLTGQLSEPQKALAYTVSSLPEHNSPLSQSGTLVVFNGQLYFYNTSTNPAVWTPVANVPDPAWTSFTPTVTASAGTITTNALEAAYQQNGKSVKFRIYWDGQSSSSTQDINFTVPVAPRNITNWQTCSSLYKNSAAAPIVAASGVFIDDSSNLFVVRSTANFPAATNIVLILQGIYEAA